jgi:hypothetical protein
MSPMLPTRLLLASVIQFVSWFCVATAAAQDRLIDSAHSVLKIRVSKSGIFSAFAHDHEIEAPVADGTVHLADNPSGALSVNARDLRVRDPDVSSRQRADIQGTGRFRGAGRQALSGGFLPIDRRAKKGRSALGRARKPRAPWQTSALDVDVVFKDNHYQGLAQLPQHDFGMAPAILLSSREGSLPARDVTRTEG